MPLTVKSPVTVKLSFIVVSEVVCPIEIGTPEVAVPIVIPFDVLELSIFKVEVLSNEIFEPSTTNVPSISVSSKLEVPSISTSLEISKVAAESSPVKVTFLKDEASLSREKMSKINLTEIINNVVEDFKQDLNNQNKKIDIKIVKKINSKNGKFILGIENRIEQVIANLLDNSISFSEDGSEVIVNVSNGLEKKVIVKILDEGQGFKEKDTSKIFNRFYIYLFRNICKLIF